MSILDTDELVIALEKALPELSEEHQLDIATWQPHDWVPWDAGRNFAFLGGEDWDPSDSTMSDEAKAALMALLLLKDNLPSYHRVLAMFFPAFSDWRALVGTWTAEDNRHAIVLRDYLVVTRAVDPVDAENRRRIHVVA
ncbi:acyl-ACP desaturase, partial [uncultured Gordonia sp.]